MRAPRWGGVAMGLLAPATVWAETADETGADESDAGRASETTTGPASHVHQGSLSERDRDRDAVAERGVLSTHAETLGAGRKGLSVHEGLFVAATLATSDDVQIGAGGLLPILESTPWLAFAQGKLVLRRTERLTVAARATVGLLSQRRGDATTGTVGAGLLADLFGREGRLSLHTGVSAHTSMGANVSAFLPVSEGAAALLEVGVEARFSDHASVVAEAWLPAVRSNDGVVAAPVALFPYVFRWGGPRAALDVGFIKVKGEFLSGDPIYIGWPYLALGARFD
jgi:hypothetical protein